MSFKEYYISKYISKDSERGPTIEEEIEYIADSIISKLNFHRTIDTKKVHIEISQRISGFFHRRLQEAWNEAFGDGIAKGRDEVLIHLGMSKEAYNASLNLKKFNNNHIAVNQCKNCGDLYNQINKNDDDFCCIQCDEVWTERAHKCL